MINLGDLELRHLAVALADAGPFAEATARAIIRVGGEAAYRNSREAAPVKTGYLRSTIYVEYDNDGLGYEVGATADYAGYVEYGTSRMPPHPFLQPSFELSVRISEFAINNLLSRL